MVRDLLLTQQRRYFMIFSEKCPMKQSSHGLILTQRSAIHDVTNSGVPPPLHQNKRLALNINLTNKQSNKSTIFIYNLCEWPTFPFKRF